MSRVRPRGRRWWLTRTEEDPVDEQHLNPQQRSTFRAGSWILLVVGWW